MPAASRSNFVTRLDAFVKRRRVVRELKVPPTIGFELIGVEDGFQDVDDESKALLVCPLTIVCFQIGSTGFEKPPPVVVERHVDVLDADVPSALSM